MGTKFGLYIVIVFIALSSTFAQAADVVVQATYYFRNHEVKEFRVQGYSGQNESTDSFKITESADGVRVIQSKLSLSQPNKVYFECIKNEAPGKGTLMRCIPDLVKIEDVYTGVMRLYIPYYYFFSDVATEIYSRVGINPIVIHHVDDCIRGRQVGVCADIRVKEWDILKPYYEAIITWLIPMD